MNRSMQKIKHLLFLLVILIASRLPFNFLRVFAYRLVGYQIGKRVSIGYETVIWCNRCIIEDNVKISHHNEIKVNDFMVGQDTRIGSFNFFIGNAYYSKDIMGANTIHIGEQCMITQEHYFDGALGLIIGDYTWFGGRGSSVWSHGSTRPNGPIHIGKRCYIGSDTKIGTDVKIGDDVLVSMGSVVIRSCPDRCTIAGNPAKVKKENYLWYEHWWVPPGFTNFPKWRRDQLMS